MWPEGLSSARSKTGWKLSDPLGWEAGHTCSFGRITEAENMKDYKCWMREKNLLWTTFFKQLGKNRGRVNSREITVKRCKLFHFMEERKGYVCEITGRGCIKTNGTLSFSVVEQTVFDSEKKGPSWNSCFYLHKVTHPGTFLTHVVTHNQSRWYLVSLILTILAASFCPGCDVMRSQR